MHMERLETEKSKEEFFRLLMQDYPEELEPNGFVTWTRDYFAYFDAHPKEWERVDARVQEIWEKDHELAVLQYSYEFLRSFA